MDNSIFVKEIKNQLVQEGIIEGEETTKEDSGSKLEQLAELEHEQWMSWAKDISKTEEVNPERRIRWKDLFVPYAELTEEMKEKDREWARKTLKVFEQQDPE